MRKKIFLFLFLLTGFISGAQTLLDTDSITISRNGAIFQIESPLLSAQWRWTGSGLAIEKLTDKQTGHQWLSPNQRAADWDTEQLCPNREARLIGITAHMDNDQGFTSQYAELSAEIFYPQSKLTAKYDIQIYPGQAGLRTQLSLKGKEPVCQKKLEIERAVFWAEGQEKDVLDFVRKRVNNNHLLLQLGDRSESDPGRGKSGRLTLEYRIDGKKHTSSIRQDQSLSIGAFQLQSNEASSCFLPFDTDGIDLLSVGYYNDHDNRNADSLPVLKEDFFKKEKGNDRKIGWASILFAEKENAGIALVKESHKVVNLQGINTGAFYVTDSGISVTGWGLSLADIRPDQYLPCWANWIILYRTGEDLRELALKKFDRARYPVSIPRDMYIMTNVWGGGREAQSAQQDNVIREIKSCAELGIDVMQIDAGWRQLSKAKDSVWLPSPDIYPQGWKNVMETAAENGIKMGIWNSGIVVGQHPELLSGHVESGFEYMKVDLKSWDNYHKLYQIIQNVRNAEILSEHRARVNFDITARWIRVGYFFGREYGNLFLQNRRLALKKQTNPQSGVYVPRRILRDGMDIAKYLNANQVQLNTVNVRLTDPTATNAWRYSNEYSFALTMMHSPLFFQETWRIEPNDRKKLKNLIDIYKHHREDIYAGYVFPIGETGSDKGWGGYQSCDPDRNTGYLTLFREIDNSDRGKSIRLHFTAGESLQIKDLLTGKTFNVQADPQGIVRFVIKKPGDFLFYQYTIL